MPFNGWDQKQQRNRMTFDCSAPFIVQHHLPLNPIGRTGITGRGLLPSWGPNHAVDPIVTRVKRGTGSQKILEWIAIQRDDTGEWSIPGGMIRDGEAEFINGEVLIKTSCLMRIITSKLLTNQGDPEGAAALKVKLAKLFKYTKNDIIYQGPADDARNTDNAWMETTAIDFHDSEGVLEDLDQHGTGIACWAELRDQDLFGSHRYFLQQIAKKYDAQWV